MDNREFIKFPPIEQGLVGPKTVCPFGEAGFLATFSGYSDVATIGIHLHHMAQKLLESPFWHDVVPAIDSLMVRYNLDRISHNDALDAFLKIINPPIADVVSKPDAIIEMPVFYDEKVGPDLNAFCRELECEHADLINRHTSKPLRVVAMGFAPGFAYMGCVDPLLERPRLQTPRAFLPAGSVGLAGAFTGIYSLPSPGGWNIIGRTPLSLFNPQQDHPFLLRHNIEVHFRSIDEDEYRYLENEGEIV